MRMFIIQKLFTVMISAARHTSDIIIPTRLPEIQLRRKNYSHNDQKPDFQYPIS
jgi:hypothetical protein